MNPLGNGRAFPSLHHMDRTTQRLLQVQDQAAQVQNGPTRLHLYQEVHIALGPRLSPRYRTEHPEIANRMPSTSDNRQRVSTVGVTAPPSILAMADWVVPTLAARSA